MKGQGVRRLRHWRRVCRRWRPAWRPRPPRRPQRRPRPSHSRHEGRHQERISPAIPVAGSVRGGGRHGGQGSRDYSQPGHEGHSERARLAQSWRGWCRRWQPAWSPRMPRRLRPPPPGHEGLSERVRLVSLVQALTAVAPRLEPKDAAQVAATLVRPSRTTSTLRPCESWRRVCRRWLLAWRPKLPRRRGLPHPGHEEHQEPIDLAELARGLSAVAARMEAKDAAQAAAQAAAYIAQARNPKDSPPAPSNWRRVCRRWRPNMQAQEPRLSHPGHEGHQDQRGHRQQGRESLAQGLVAVAARMEPKDAAQSTVSLIQAMKDIKDPSTEGDYPCFGWRGGFGSGARLPAKDARRPPRRPRPSS